MIDIPKPSGAVPAIRPTTTLILEGNPEAQFAYAQSAAKVLMRRVEGKKRKIVISGKQYLEYGDWQTLARFFGATAATEWTRRLEIDGKIVGYESRGIVFQHSEIISAAEALCLRSERNWNKREWHAIMSMAQTRACAKALRNAFGWVAELGGYADTPAEEMESEDVITDELMRASSSVPISAEGGGGEEAQPDATDRPVAARQKVAGQENAPAAAHQSPRK